MPILTAAADGFSCCKPMRAVCYCCLVSARQRSCACAFIVFATDRRTGCLRRRARLPCAGMWHGATVRPTRLASARLLFVSFAILPFYKATRLAAVTIVRSIRGGYERDQAAAALVRLIFEQKKTAQRRQGAPSCSALLPWRREGRCKGGGPVEGLPFFPNVHVVTG